MCPMQGLKSVTVYVTECRYRWNTRTQALKETDRFTNCADPCSYARGSRQCIDVLGSPVRVEVRGRVRGRGRGRGRVRYGILRNMSSGNRTPGGRILARRLACYTKTHDI